jgi:hypothetical protein
VNTSRSFLSTSQQHTKGSQSPTTCHGRVSRCRSMLD